MQCIKGDDALGGADPARQAADADGCDGHAHRVAGARPGLAVERERSAGRAPGRREAAHCGVRRIGGEFGRGCSAGRSSAAPAALGSDSRTLAAASWRWAGRAPNSVIAITPHALRYSGTSRRKSCRLRSRSSAGGSAQDRPAHGGEGSSCPDSAARAFSAGALANTRFGSPCPIQSPAPRA